MGLSFDILHSTCFIFFFFKLAVIQTYSWVTNRNQKLHFDSLVDYFLCFTLTDKSQACSYAGKITCFTCYCSR